MNSKMAGTGSTSALQGSQILAERRTPSDISIQICSMMLKSCKASTFASTRELAISGIDNILNKLTFAAACPVGLRQTGVMKVFVTPEVKQVS
jgi:hypothetical protein